MPTNVERGTQAHVSYADAFRREQRQGRIAFFTWLALLLFVSPFIEGTWWFSSWLLFLALCFYGIGKRWSKKRTHIRAYRNSNTEKPL